MTHEERLALIYHPFQITRFGPSYQWAGAAAGDNFYGDPGIPWAARPLRGAGGGVSDSGTVEGGGVSFEHVRRTNDFTRMMLVRR